jgi:UDP-glucose 4-epimerase
MAGLTVAVTGTSTYVGEDLLRELEADRAVDRILAVDPKPPAFEGPKTHWVKLDLMLPRAPEALARELTEERCSVLIHTAFLARPTHRGSWAHELEAIGTNHVLTAAAAAKLPKLVVRSTTLCYGALASNPNYLPESAQLQGGTHSAFIADKVEVEKQVTRFAQQNPDCTVTILRFAPLLGPRADTIISKFLMRRVVFTLLGFDPLLQVLHEEDAIGATVAAVHRDVRGAINVAAPGVVPLSQAIQLAGSRPVPLPQVMLSRSLHALWATRAGDYPPGHIGFLKYLLVGDLGRMQKELQYKPRMDVVRALQAFRAVKQTGLLAA